MYWLFGYTLYGRDMWHVGRSVYRVLVGKPEGKRPLGRPEHKWDDNVQMDLQEMGWGHGLD
jgi:hypothetical protein